MKIPLDHQIAEVAREIALRKSVYPHFVRVNKLSQEEADKHFARMEGVLETLIWLRDNRAAVIEGKSE